MIYLKSYKLFEEKINEWNGAPNPSDVFPYDHRLAGKDIKKTLKEIYNQLPQEEITYRKEDWIESYGEDSYKTMVDIDESFVKGNEN